MLGLPALSEPDYKPFSDDALGCLKLRECTEDVEEVYSIAEIEAFYGDPKANFSLIEVEANEILHGLKDLDIKVFIADARYFPTNTRGVYYVDTNTMFLNSGRLTEPHQMINLLRHEGWHAVQDCMAGTIDNTFIAVVYDDALIPQYWKNLAQRLYPTSAVPWEQEAKWVGTLEGETGRGLKSCSVGRMWENYKPTPMTQEWLETNGYM